MSAPPASRTVAAGAATVALRRVRRRRRALRALAGGLTAYGVAGLVLLAVVGWAVGGPVDQIVSLGRSLELQRAAALDALERTSQTIAEAAGGVGNMDSSLSQAQTATDRSAVLAEGVAASMYQLGEAMTATILGMQPLIGLSTGFQQTGDQLMILADDLTSIGQALDQNRQDAVTVAQSLDELAAAVDDLTKELRGGPAIEVDPASADIARLGIYAMLAWLGLLALAAIVAGAYCWRLAGRDAAVEASHEPVD